MPFKPATAPIPFDPEGGAEAWRTLCDTHGTPRADLRPLIEGAAGCSPYLARLVAQEGAWLCEALADTPEAAMAGLIDGVPGTDASLAALNSGLRQAKRRAALWVALCDLGGVWPVLRTTAALTEFADAAVGAALRWHVAAEAGRGRLPRAARVAGDRGEAAGLFVLAMGKMGAGELNYSSDIDLICLFDEEVYGEATAEAKPALVRVTRRMAQTLSEVTADGYVFRTDLRLRPDAASTPVCLPAGWALRYYEAQGRSWERAAHIKARPCAGDLRAGAAYLQRLRPFVWRRHLDFAQIADASDMRQRIRAHKGLDERLLDEDLRGRDVKLGPGGIREIEFFTQTRQLIAGGRDPDLRLRGTVDGLAALARKRWVPPDVAATLSDDYQYLRRIEHRLQMVRDAQTHSLPRDAEGMARLAAFVGLGGEAALRRDLTALFARVSDLAEPFFAPGPKAADMPDISPASAEIVARWPSYPALRSERGRAIFERLKPDLLQRFQSAARPDEALANFDRFLRGLPAGVQLFSLFEATPRLRDLLVDICATAPALAAYLSKHSGVLDAVLAGAFFAPWPGPAALRADLARALAGLDYEGQLDAARRWMKERHFRLGVHLLRGLIGAEEAGRHYAGLARAVIACLWPAVLAETARRHGWIAGAEGVVVGMGSLGAGTLAASSDLDLIVIYEAPEGTVSDGRRALDARGWFAKATRTLVSALSAPTAEGRLYEVDMRLRPSGRQGPVATALHAFERYQRTEAWTWEHLALTRARPVAGSRGLTRRIERVRRQVLAGSAGRGDPRGDTAAMRARIRAAEAGIDPLEPKAGRGRLRDLELFAQMLALRSGSHRRATAAQLAAGRAAGLINADAAACLLAAERLLQTQRHALALVTEGQAGDATLGQGGRAFLARAAGQPDIKHLQDALASAAADTADVIDAHLPESDP